MMTAAPYDVCLAAYEENTILPKCKRQKETKNARVFFVFFNRKYVEVDNATKKCYNDLIDADGLKRRKKRV